MTDLPLPTATNKDAFCQAASELVNNTVDIWLARNPTFKQYGRDTFISAAWLGVLEAHGKYDAERSDRVLPFVRQMIRWKLLEELNDTIGPSQGLGMTGGQWSKIAKVRKWASLFEQAEQRRPTKRDAVAAFPDIDSNELLDVIAGRFVEMEDVEVLSEKGVSADDWVQGRQFMAIIEEWLNTNLNVRDKAIYLKSKLHGMKDAEIGRAFSLTERRINQIVRAVHSRLTNADFPD